MITETEAFEEARVLRERLAAFLGLPDGKDPDYIAFTYNNPAGVEVRLPSWAVVRLLDRVQGPTPAQAWGYRQVALLILSGEADAAPEAFLSKVKMISSQAAERGA